MDRPIVFTLVLVAALSAFAIGRFSGSGNRPPVVVQTGFPVPAASIDLKCGDTKYTVSTGNTQGECQTGSTPAQNAVCSDGKGNSSEVSCGHGCMNSKGAGSCTIK
jgi:hypothetical protein